jgi:hippurate hydrolase
MTPIDQIAAAADEFVAIRRDLHAHPELGLEETRTSALVAERLAAWGYTVTTRVAKTGVVGTLARGSSRKAIGIRADMDALPIQEETGAPYASRNPGLMHACGHDGHTTMLLAAARALAERSRFDGTVHLIFQPAEENFGGARLMIEDGLFERFPVDAVFGLHNEPGQPAGRLGFKPGPICGSIDEVQVTLRGVGGHGAAPDLARDPIVAGASLVMALQTIVSRNVDPRDVGNITVGAFQAGHVCNVIPETAWMTMGLRAFTPEVRALLARRVREITEGTAATFGMTAEINAIEGYPVTVNDPAMTDFARKVGLDLLGPDAVWDIERPFAGGEDFSFMLEHRPGSFMILGQGEHVKSLHNPGYDFNDATIPVGAGYWVELAERFLKAA